MKTNPFGRASLLFFGFLASCIDSHVPVFTRATSAERSPIIVRGTEGTSQYDPAIGASAKGLVIAWCETDGTSDRLMLGAVTDGGLEVNGTLLELPHASWSTPTLTKRPDGWLLSAQSGPGNVALWFVDDEGHVGPGRDLGGAGYEGHFSAVRLDEGLFAAWTSGINGEYDVWGGFIGEGITPVIDAGSLTPGPRYEYRPSVARVGTDVFMAWDRHSSVANHDQDVTWRWLGADAGGTYGQVQNQHVATAAAASQALAVVVWFDEQTEHFIGGRVKTSGDLLEAPVALAASAGQIGAASLSTEAGAVLAFTAQRGAQAALRLVLVPGVGSFEAGGVWFAGGVSATNVAREGRPSLSGGWVAFTRSGADGGSEVRVMPFGTKPLGAECDTNQACLTGRCSEGVCAEE